MTFDLSPPLLAIYIPLIGALLIALAGRFANLREGITLGTAVALFYTVIGIVPRVLAPDFWAGYAKAPPLRLVEVVPHVFLELKVEPLGMIFALIASALWILNSLYSIGYMRGNQERHQTRFYVCFALAISSVMGLAFAGNLFTLFVFYEMLTLTTYPLVAHKGTAEALRSARTYLGILVVTSVCFLLAGIIATYAYTGDLSFKPGGVFTKALASGELSAPVLGTLFVLYMYGIGKAALMPMHRWLPAAMVAPTPVSALLHAVAVVKAGVFTVVKVIVYTFGPLTLIKYNEGSWLIYVAGATILIASTIALFQDNLKRRLAYSTVSQLSYVIIAAALLSPISIMAAALHIAAHAFGKITLFFCAGAILVATHKTEISQMHGLGRRMPFTFAAFLLASLSIIGLPPTGGSWSKWQLMLATADTGQMLLMATLMASSLLSVAYLLPVAVIGFMAPATGGSPGHPEPVAGIHEAPLLCVAPLWFTAIGTVGLFFFAEPLYAFLEPLVR